MWDCSPPKCYNDPCPSERYTRCRTSTPLDCCRRNVCPPGCATDWCVRGQNCWNYCPRIDCRRSCSAPPKRRLEVGFTAPSVSKPQSGRGRRPKSVDSYKPKTKTVKLKKIEKLKVDVPKSTVKKGKMNATPPPTAEGTSASETCSPACEEQEYLHFLLRITEDILRNDLYTNTGMDKVFESHIQANINRLNEAKMRQQVENLKKELNYPLLEQRKTESEGIEALVCLCDPAKREILNSIMTCDCCPVHGDPEVPPRKAKGPCNCENNAFPTNIATEVQKDIADQDSPGPVIEVIMGESEISAHSAFVDLDSGYIQAGHRSSASPKAFQGSKRSDLNPTKINAGQVDNKIKSTSSADVKLNAVTKIEQQQFGEVVYYDQDADQITCDCPPRKTGLKIEMTENNDDEYVLVDGPVCLPRKLVENKGTPVLIATNVSHDNNEKRKCGCSLTAGVVNKNCKRHNQAAGVNATTAGVVAIGAPVSYEKVVQKKPEDEDIANIMEDENLQKVPEPAIEASVSYEKTVQNKPEDEDIANILEDENLQKIPEQESASLRSDTSAEMNKKYHYLLRDASTYVNESDFTEGDALYAAPQTLLLTEEYRVADAELEPVDVDMFDAYNTEEYNKPNELETDEPELLDDQRTIDDTTAWDKFTATPNTTSKFQGYNIQARIDQLLREKEQEVDSSKRPADTPGHNRLNSQTKSFSEFPIIGLSTTSKANDPVADEEEIIGITTANDDDFSEIMRPAESGALKSKPAQKVSYDRKELRVLDDIPIVTESRSQKENVQNIKARMEDFRTIEESSDDPPQRTEYDKIADTRAVRRSIAPPLTDSDDSMDPGQNKPKPTCCGFGQKKK